MSLTPLARALAPAFARLRAADDAIIADQVAIARIPAPTGGESRRAAWIAQRLATNGLRDVRVDDAGNVLGSGGARNDVPPLVLCAHLDTVFDAAQAVEVRRLGNRLAAPGISDNARGLATLVALAGEFGPRGIPTARPVLFAATTGEEGHGDLRGARHLFATAGRDAHAAIALDGPGDRRIVNAALGARRYHVAFRGPGGHSWGAQGAPNAVHAAAAFVTRLSALAAANRPQAGVTASRIAGGHAVNAIPADAWIEVDVRSGIEDELARLDAAVRRAALAAADGENAGRRSGTAPLAVMVTLTGSRPAGSVAESERVVASAVAATHLVGRDPELALASTDANIPISLGIPAIAIGAGGIGGGTHTPAEWFENRDGATGIARALLTVTAVAAAPA
jgi:acetylornithine deacetylase/succinyl-diaminopimelate desuccinylase-like protein